MKSCKILQLILLTLILIFQITACQNTDNDDVHKNDIDNIGSITGEDDFDIEKYIYLSHEKDVRDLDGLINPLGGAIAYGNTIVLWYLEYNDIIVVKLSSDGNTRHETRLTGPVNLCEVKSLSITDDGHYIIIATTAGTDDDVTIHYLIYDERGEETVKQELLIIPQYFSTFTRFEYVVITDTSIVLVTVTNNNYTIHVLTKDGEKLGEIFATNLKGAVRLSDDRVAVLINEGASSSLNEIDLTNGGWGEIHRIEISAVVGLRSDSTVWAIIEEEFQNFKNGLRSSADTARIIQNRVQTYLNEMS